MGDEVKCKICGSKIPIEKEDGLIKFESLVCPKCKKIRCPRCGYYIIRMEYSKKYGVITGFNCRNPECGLRKKFLILI